MNNLIIGIAGGSGSGKTCLLYTSLILCFSIAPVSPSILLCFLLGAAMIIVGIMFLSLIHIFPELGEG